MKQSFTVLNSDRVNKYGYLIPLSVMEDMMWETATEGVPMHIGHDMHRLIGCIIPFALYFEPSLVRHLGLALYPESEQDSNQIINLKRYSHHKNLNDDIEKNDNLLTNILKDKLSEHHKLVSAGTLAVLDKNIVERQFPELFKLSEEDKAGLIKIDDINKSFSYKQHGVFIHKELPLCIYSHNYFRKSLSRHNNYHHLFLDEFMKHSEDKNITLKLAIDWDMIGYAPDFKPRLEFEYWFGPKYDDDISNISPGLTKHSCTEFERNYYEISSTEFFWKNNKNLKEFELEELRENNAPTMDDFFGCRYIHSIYDTQKKTFIHFDGAVRGYTSDLFFERMDKNMTEFGRKSEYKKLFRIDGALQLKDWKNLITKYMQGNPLIYEYFDMDKPKSQFDDDELKRSLLEEFVPHSITKDEGIRMLVSYHERNEKFKAESHSVSIYDIVSDGNSDFQVVESNIIEIKKALKRLGRNLQIKDDVLIGDFKDEYWNIPCIFHNSESLEDDIRITLLAFKSVFSKMIERNLNCYISFTLSWNMEDKEVRVSSYGHVENLFDWLVSFNKIPSERNNFKKWLENQREYLNSNFKEVVNKPFIKDIAQFDGVLYVKRVMVQDKFKITPKEVDNSLIGEFIIPPTEKDKYSSLIDGTISPVMAYIIDKNTCSKTGMDYMDSPYSKFLDDDVYSIIEKISSMNFYWTDRPIR